MFIIISDLICYYGVLNRRKIADAKTDFLRLPIRSEEQERNRIANELHGGFGLNLRGINHRAMPSTRKGDDPASDLKEINESSSVLVLKEVNKITCDLSQKLLDRRLFAENVAA